MNDRDAQGRLLPGNLAALKHGAYSPRVAAGELPEQSEARAAAADRRAQIEADLGGQLSALAQGHVEAYIRLELVADFLWTNLQSNGPLTAKGRSRAALTAWLAVLDRMTKLAVTLGLERRAKQVPDPLAFIEGRV